MGTEHETQRPCPACGRTVDLHNVKPGNKTDCPHCKKDGRPRQVIRRRKTAPPLADLEAAAAAGWEDEAAGSLDWRDMLGAELTDPAARCDSRCPCSQPLWRYTADHTATLCPECGPACWAESDEAIDRGDRHAQANAPARRPGAPGGPTQAEAWASDRATKRHRADLLARVDAGLRISRISAGSRLDLDWFANMIAAADARTLDQLAADLDTYTIERSGWPTRTAAVPQLDDDDNWDDEDEDQDDEDDDEDQEMAEGGPYDRPRRTPAGAPPVTGGSVLPILPRAPGWTDARYQQEIARRLDQQRQAHQAVLGRGPQPNLWDLR
jgi:hypothetical protein